MAGAGTIVEKLPVVSVPDFLSEGGKFLKWDDVSIFYDIHRSLWIEVLFSIPLNLAPIYANKLNREFLRLLLTVLG